MCRNTHHANQAEHPQLQVTVTTMTVLGELYSLKQGGLFLPVAEDTNNTTAGRCCSCAGNRKRKSLVASLAELLSKPWTVRECRVVMNEWDMFMAPRVQPSTLPTVCQHGSASPFTASQRCNGDRGRGRETGVIELEGNHTYEHSRR
ncbi:hypothetical protein F4813DRAFT_388483 [Daldinia decipiens]|uniref:uncharacterized protein n=1 Tax=Daldinia decipiens TaxID=326647 RepID=UPI0020C431C9|nr:uncharacterized protein F4813DRAFT_388483 [Daldinia decipiens]KAI1658717.1 hypothetical protein F4813DRAFT_388483 [Daldinia decipiens]